MKLVNTAWFLLLRPSINTTAIAFQYRLDTSLTSLSKKFQSKQTRRQAFSVSAANNMKSNEDEYRLFGRFKIDTNQIFYRSTHSFAMVNLRPLVPGHVLVVSNRVVPLLSDLECKFFGFE